MVLAGDVADAVELVAWPELAAVHASGDRPGDVEIARHGADCTRAYSPVAAPEDFARLPYRSAALQKGTGWVYARVMSGDCSFRCR